MADRSLRAITSVPSNKNRPSWERGGVGCCLRIPFFTTVCRNRKQDPDPEEAGHSDSEHTTMPPPKTGSRENRFSFEEFSKELPLLVVKVLKKEEFNTLSALLSARATDIEALKMKRGHIAEVLETVKKLQETHQQGPLFISHCGERKKDPDPVVAGQSPREQPLLLVTVETPPPEPGPEFRVVLIGKTGKGKSALGNTLLGHNAFKSVTSMSSFTQKCQWAQGSIDGTLLSVTDTPGLADTDRLQKEILPEITKSVSVACPGPHVVIMVIRCDHRFTNEEHQVVTTLKNLFGEQLCRFLMVVFTGGDGLKVPRERMQLALQQTLVGAPDNLKEVMCDVGSAYCVVDNNASSDEKKGYARDVLGIMKAILTRNKGEYFTNGMVEKCNKIVQAAADHRETTENISHEEAMRETRKAIVEDKELPEVFRELVDATGDFLCATATFVKSAVTTTASAVTTTASAVREEMQNCQVM